MESKIVHQQLNTVNNEVETRKVLSCYLQYLVDYRRDVPDKDEYVIYELQSLQSTQYVKNLALNDPIRKLLLLSDSLEDADEKGSRSLWTELRNAIANL